MAPRQHPLAALGGGGPEHGVLFEVIDEEDAGVVEAEAVGDEADNLVQQFSHVPDGGGLSGHLGCCRQLDGPPFQVLRPLRHPLLQRADQLSNPGGHPVEGLRQHADLVLPLHLHHQVQVALGDLNGGPNQVGQGRGDASGDEQRRQRRQPHCDERDPSVNKHRDRCGLERLRPGLFGQHPHPELRQPVVDPDHRDVQVVGIYSRSIDMLVHRRIDAARTDVPSNGTVAQPSEGNMVSTDQIGLAGLPQARPLEHDLVQLVHTDPTGDDAYRLPFPVLHRPGDDDDRFLKCGGAYREAHEGADHAPCEEGFAAELLAFPGGEGGEDHVPPRVHQEQLFEPPCLCQDELEMVAQAVVGLLVGLRGGGRSQEGLHILHPLFPAYRDGEIRLERPHPRPNLRLLERGHRLQVAERPSLPAPQADDGGASADRAGQQQGHQEGGDEQAGADGADTDGTDGLPEDQQHQQERYGRYVAPQQGGLRDVVAGQRLELLDQEDVGQVQRQRDPPHLPSAGTGDEADQGGEQDGF